MLKLRSDTTLKDQAMYQQHNCGEVELRFVVKHHKHEIDVVIFEKVLKSHTNNQMFAIKYTYVMELFLMNLILL